jgi:hypothetical protein
LSARPAQGKTKPKAKKRSVPVPRAPSPDLHDLSKSSSESFASPNEPEPNESSKDQPAKKQRVKAKAAQQSIAPFPLHLDEIAKTNEKAKVRLLFPFIRFSLKFKNAFTTEE